MPLDRSLIASNLMSYKLYVRPKMHRLYGSDVRASKSKHQQNVHDLLHVLFIHGINSTWNMAKLNTHRRFGVREQEKIYRRLLVGRADKRKRSDGVLDNGLVFREIDSKTFAKYRLTLFGILYCIEVLQPSKTEYDKMATQYSFLVPKIFGRWEEIKSILGDDVYNLLILSKGIYLNNLQMAHSENPLYELMSYVHIKYSRNFESMIEDDLADQISYWFYTYLLHVHPEKLKKILNSDGNLSQWYKEYFSDAKKYYAQRLYAMQNSDIFSNT